MTSGYGSASQCLTSNGSGSASSWGTCGSGGDSFWTLNSGLLYPGNTTVDLAIGGTSSSSAKFLFQNVLTGTPTFKVFDSSSAQSLNLSHDGTNGNITASTGTINIGAGGGTLYVETDIMNDTANNSGYVQLSDKLLVQNSEAAGNALAVFNNTGAGDLLTASASGVTKFTISNSGDVTFAGGDITGANGAAIDIGEATSGDIEITGDLLPASDATYDLGSTTKSWQNIYLTGNLCFDDTDCMSTSTTGYWDQTNGALYPKISTVDLLIGGTSTASAKFAVLNMSGTGTPVASVSSGLSGTSAYLTADGTLATQNRMALTIGNSSTYNTTGNVLINPNGTGNVGIGTTGPGYLLDVNGLAHAATALVVGTNPATGGSLRLPTDTGVNVRNEANTLNIQLIGLSSGNVLRIGGGGDVAPAGVNVNTGTVGLYPESDNDSPLGTATNRWSRLVVGTGISSFAGNVGIGTTTPDARLEINHATGDSLRLTYNDSDGSAANYTDFELASDGSLALTSTGADVTLVSDFNTGVNIGASSNTPAALSISGGIGSNAALIVNQTNSADVFTASASGATKFRLDNSGNVILAGGAISDTSDGVDINDALEIAGTTTAQAIVPATDDTYTLGASSNSFNTGYFGSGGIFFNDDVNIWRSATNTLRHTAASVICTNCSYGIGTLIPNAVLHVTGGITGGNSALIVDQTGASSNDIMAASASGITKFRLTNGGAVYAASFYDLDNTSYFIDPAATNISLATVGKVGIGTINPGMALEVNALSGTTAITKIQGSTSYAALNIDQTGVGDLIAASLSAATKFLVKNNGDVVVGAGGAGKITVTTIDPLYNIDGGKYSTYAPSMIGVKEEITGKASIAYDETQGAYAYTLDFNSFENGSDFWVFSRVIDPDIERVSVLLTPNSQARTWYRKDPVRRLLTFYSDRPTEISYRLTAPRFDYERWGTISNDTEAGLAAPPAPPPVGNGTPDGEDDFFANLNIRIRNGAYELADSLGNAVKRVEGFSDLIAANLTAGLINAQDITTNTLSVANDSLTIGGQTLRDYIASTVENILNTRYKIQDTDSIVSPLASIDQIHTNTISPLADNQIDIKGDIAIKDKNNQTVAKIDTKGDLTVQNASISGSLVADSARVNSLTLERFNNAGDATVSGTLYADKIQANSIEGLEARIASIASQTITSNSVSSIQYLVSSESADFIASVENGQLSIVNGQMLDIGTISSDFATFRDGLIALGPATFNQASVLESFSIGSSFIFGPNSMNTLGLDLEIQPLKQGAISFMAGAVRINTDGTLVVNENATFAKDVSVRGKLSANIISPLPDQDLILHLGRWRGNDLDSSEVDGLPRGGKLEVQNSSDSAVLSVNQAGDLTSSGSGTFAKLNLFTQPVEAVSDTEVVATSSAGTAILKRYRTELTISNPLVTDKSLIYITPVGNTNGQALYLLRQVPASTAGGKESFTVGVAAPAIADIKFNWIIVN